MNDGRAVLVYGDGEWFLDMAQTSAAGTIGFLFGTTYLPLPLTSRVGREDALKFARLTPMGQQYGVRD